MDLEIDTEGQDAEVAAALIAEGLGLEPQDVRERYPSDG